MENAILKYFAPRQPERLDNPNFDELMPFARKAVNNTGGRVPLGLIKPGEKLLIVHFAHQDKLVIDVITEAFKEKDIEVEFVPDYEVVGIPFNDLASFSVEEGWNEITWKKGASSQWVGR